MLGSQDSSQDVYVINSTINNVHGNQINLTQLRENHSLEISRRLAAPDPSSNHNAACKKRQPDTGNWLINGDVFVEWKTRPFLLWLHGPAGSGKTVLSSTIIQDIQTHCSADPSLALAYFYFDFQDAEKQRCEHLLRSLVSQFSEHCLHFPDALTVLHQELDIRIERYSRELLTTTLKRVAAAFQHAYIVVDALDESTEREAVLNLLHDVMASEPGSLHILITSRNEQEIGDGLAGHAHKDVDLAETVVGEDIAIHVREQLENDVKLKKWPKKVRAEIQESLLAGAHGMFRWVSCQLDELRKCAKPAEVRKTLGSLPKTLDDTYERMLVNIDELYRDDVQKVLRWLSFARRPIHLDEMVEALAVNFACSCPTFDPDERYPDSRDIITRCSSLVSTSGSPGDKCTLRLAHLSVKEYLISDRIRQSRARMYGVVEEDANDFIAQTCLAYLLQFKVADCPNSFTIKDYPLADYAARYWRHHSPLKLDASSPNLQASMLDLFQPSEGQDHPPQFVTWVRLFDFDDSSPHDMQLNRPPNEIASPLYYASLIGTLSVARALVKNRECINMQQGEHGSALQAAASEGYEAIVRLLLESGADANIRRGSHDSTALQIASSEGHEGIVKLLLDRGADVNAQGGHHGGALRAASSEGHEGIVKLLLESGADPSIEGGHHGSALLLACSAGHEGIVKLLLQHGANANQEDGYHGGPLRRASELGHEGIVRILLQHGVDVDTRSYYHPSALQMASIDGYVEIVRMLLQHGADPHRGGHHSCALYNASLGGHEEIVRLLLEYGADANGVRAFHRLPRPIEAAAEAGHERVVKILLEHGAQFKKRRGLDAVL